ncbi:MAG TPA: hypothetical protein VIL32_00515 [Steroidobacteraceae bacterium]
MTTNRREFLQAVAISGLPVFSHAAGAFETSRTIPARCDLHAILFDERHAQACALGACLASNVGCVHAIPDGDITQVWLNQIAPVWRNQPVPLAGLTTRSALFCLEQLAIPYGLRVVFHAEHVIHPDGRIEHSLLRGAEQAHLTLDDLKRAGTSWPARIAEAIATHRRQAAHQRFGLSDASLEPTLPPGAQLLTSWIIA